MPQTQYSAMKGMLAESKIGQSTGAPGLFWEKLMEGEGRETVRDWLQKRANEVAAASSALAIKNLVTKAFSLAAMAATPAGWGEAARIGIGALSSGGLTKYFGDKEVGKLDTSGLDMSKILYGREQAQGAEDTAQSAMNRLIEGVDAQAVSNAFTTPLMYYTLKNTFGGAPTDGGESLVAAGGEGAKFAAGDMGKLFAAGQEGYKQKGFQDLLSLIGRGAKSGGDIPSVTLGTDISNYYNNPYLRL